MRGNFIGMKALPVNITGLCFLNRDEKKRKKKKGGKKREGGRKEGVKEKKMRG